MPRRGRKVVQDLGARPLHSGAHLLVVEDDGEMRRLVAQLLREAGFRVTPCRDGRDLWEAIGAAPPDAVLLDIMLPGISGLDLLRQLRERSRVPVLMLTARAEEMDRSVALELGADDYLIKPFAPADLVVRIRALLDRANDEGDEGQARCLTFAGWSLDTTRRELTDSDGVSVDLSTTEYDLLLTFLKHPHLVLTRQHLSAAAGRQDSSGAADRTVDIQIARLRRKIEMDPASPEMLRTVHEGYLFVPGVAGE